MQEKETSSIGEVTGLEVTPNGADTPQDQAPGESTAQEQSPEDEATQQPQYGRPKKLKNVAAGSLVAYEDQTYIMVAPTARDPSKVKVIHMGRPVYLDADAMVKVVQEVVTHGEVPE